MAKRLPGRRQFLALSTCVISTGVAGCIETLEESTGGGGDTWMPREEIEGGVWKEDQGWINEDQLLELVNGKINERRHERGMGSVNFDISLKNELTNEVNTEPVEAPSGVEVDDDPFYCRGRMTIVHVTVSYESRYDDEDGLLINADRDTIASDAVEKMASSDDMSQVLFDPDFESHAARVNVGDQGAVYLPNAFCGPEP